MAAMKAPKNKPFATKAKVLFYDGLRVFATEVPHGLKVVFWPIESQRHYKNTPATMGRLILLTNAPRESHVLLEVDGVPRKECGRMMRILGFCFISGDHREGHFLSSRKMSRNHRSHDSRNKLINQWVKGEIDTCSR